MLESQRLLFKPWTINDYNHIKQIFGNPNVCQYLPGNNQKSEEEIKKWLQHFVNSYGDQKGNEIYKVSLKGKNQVIGYCGLSYVKEFDKIEIMYGLDETYWRQGFGLEMSLTMKSLAMTRNHHHLIALADISNQASNRILKKTGFELKKQVSLWGLELNFYDMRI